MIKIVTVKLEQNILEKARQIAQKHNKSLSQWVADLITQNVEEKDSYAQARATALAHLRKGFHLGGKPLSREQLHERR